MAFELKTTGIKVFVSTLLLAAPLQAGTPQYEVVELPSVGDIVELTRPRVINNEGNVAGASADNTLTQRAAFWPNTTVVELDPTTEPSPSEARGISPDGLIAGWLNDPGTGLRAARWEDNQAMLFDPLPGHIASRGSDVNDNGVLVGWSIDDIGDSTAVKWAGGDIVQLAESPSLAIAVNESNQIVGRQDVGVQRRALLWHGDQMIELPDLGGNAASPSDINQAGAITGASISGETQKFHAVMWDSENHDIADLGLYQSFPTGAEGLNNNGQIVGDATINPVTGESRALLWQNGEMINLNNMINDDSPWTLQSAQDINDDGVIVGWGIRDDAAGIRGFKLVPIQPTDINDDGTVDVNDLLALLAAWGPCDGSCPEDVNSDGTVNVNDLLALLADFSD